MGWPNFQDCLLANRESRPDLKTAGLDAAVGTIKNMKGHAAPIIAAVLLLLPVLYVASYLALVNPNGKWRGPISPSGGVITLEHYRFGGPWTASFYWPLEQIDRRMRPKVWSEPRVFIY